MVGKLPGFGKTRRLSANKTNSAVLQNGVSLELTKKFFDCLGQQFDKAFICQIEGTAQRIGRNNV